MNREEDLRAIRKAVEPFIRFTSDRAFLAAGDSLQILKLFPPKSVSLILTDPPYHSTNKRNIYGDTLFKKDSAYLEWMSEFAKEWQRILKPNGSFFCFCSPEMAARIEVMFSERFNILSRIVWTKPNDPGFDGWKQKMKKESLRQWYAQSERIIFAEPAFDGNLHRSHFGCFLKDARKRAGLSTNRLAEIIGAYGRVNHGGAVSNWEAGRNTPSREQYSKICIALTRANNALSMPSYEDAIRRFVIDSSKEFTDVWTFPSVRPYKGKHPAEKPLLLLEHAIEATTYPDDIVLDCFAGSGNTALASTKTGRRSISIEIDVKWVDSIAYKLANLSQETLFGNLG
jgi:site-specific DNA-methyltransferase (adenine-specific)